ncbi:hypothetical protein [Bacterioplanoides sp.]|uniref:hypothetical protein n=1 Tax=Bacterioplanoides sp. TaxID=2066072 RepID=UPI003B006BF5
MKFFAQISSLVFALVILAGCAAKVANYDAISQNAARDAAVADESAARTIQHAQSKLELGRSEKLAFYAPRHLKLASEQLAEAQNMHISGDPDGPVKTAAMRSIKTLEAGLQTKQQILTRLKPTLDHRAVLLNIRADDFFPTDFAGLEQSLLELIDLMEDNRIAEVTKEQQQLLARMHQVEVNTIEYIQLQPVKDHLQRIDNKGGPDVAPISWQTAQTVLQQAQALIAKTPRAKGAIAKATIAATRATQHAEVITDLSNEIAEARSQEAEAIALRMERWLYRISVALQHDDIRHQTLSDQASEYAAAIKALSHQ